MSPSAQDGTKFVDLSHAVVHGMVTYRGLPAPLICDYLSREQSRQHYLEGTEFQIGKIEMVANTGTYLDAPFHRYSNGEDLSQLDLNRVANLDAIMVRANSQPVRGIDASFFSGVSVKGKAVLVQTGWDAHWGSENYFEENPFIASDAARFLADAGAKLVGIDSVNIDNMDDLTRPAHSVLLKAGIPIVEHLCNLDALPNEGFRFFAVPVKVKGMGTFPVRALRCFRAAGRFSLSKLRPNIFRGVN